MNMHSPRAAAAAAILAAAALVAGCGAAAPAAPRAPAPAATRAPATSPAAVSVNARACRAITTGPAGPSTLAGLKHDATVLTRDAAKRGVSLRLSGAMERLAAGLQAAILGAGSKAQLQGDLRHLQTVCRSYGT